MYASAELAAGGLRGAASSPVRETRESQHALGPAMRVMLALAVARAAEGAAPGSGRTIQALWDLAERFHPEQAWLAACWLRNERTLDELIRQAPREGLAPGLRAVFGRPPYPSPGPAQDLRDSRVFAQE